VCCWCVGRLGAAKKRKATLPDIEEAMDKPTSSYRSNFDLTYPPSARRVANPVSGQPPTVTLFIVPSFVVDPHFMLSNFLFIHAVIGLLFMRVRRLTVILERLVSQWHRGHCCSVNLALVKASLPSPIPPCLGGRQWT